MTANKLNVLGSGTAAGASGTAAGAKAKPLGSCNPVAKTLTDPLGVTLLIVVPRLFDT